jgi:hypothetical protein
MWRKRGSGADDDALLLVVCAMKNQNLTSHVATVRHVVCLTKYVADSTIPLIFFVYTNMYNYVAPCSFIGIPHYHE